jgi:hypothetical protein
MWCPAFVEINQSQHPRRHSARLQTSTTSQIRGQCPPRSRTDLSAMGISAFFNYVGGMATFAQVLLALPMALDLLGESLAPRFRRFV